MTRKTRRVLNLIVLPPWCGFSSALFAPAFDNDPVLMAFRGTIAGLVVGAIWLAVAEA